MTTQNITISTEQLSELVAQAVAAALAAQSPAKPEGAALPKSAAKDEKYLRYFEGKKEVALRYAAKKGEHYYVCRKPHSRKLMVWGDSTRATAKRRGQNPDETLGKVQALVKQKMTDLTGGIDIPGLTS